MATTGYKKAGGGGGGGEGQLCNGVFCAEDGDGPLLCCAMCLERCMLGWQVGFDALCLHAVLEW
jgi:hypothetical protein